MTTTLELDDDLVLEAQRLDGDHREECARSPGASGPGRARERQASRPIRRQRNRSPGYSATADTWFKVVAPRYGSISCGPATRELVNRRCAVPASDRRV